MNDLLFLHSLSLPFGYYTNLFYEQEIRVIPFHIYDNLKISMFTQADSVLAISENFTNKDNIISIVKKHFLKLPKNTNKDKEINKIFNELTKLSYKEFTIVCWGNSIILAILLAERLNSIGFNVKIRAYGSMPIIKKDFVEYFSHEDDCKTILPFFKTDIFNLQNEKLKKPNIIKWLLNYNDNQKNHDINEYYNHFLRNKKISF